MVVHCVKCCFNGHFSSVCSSVRCLSLCPLNPRVSNGPTEIVHRLKPLLRRLCDWRQNSLAFILGAATNLLNLSIRQAQILCACGIRLKKQGSQSLKSNSKICVKGVWMKKWREMSLRNSSIRPKDGQHRGCVSR